MKAMRNSLNFSIDNFRIKNHPQEHLVSSGGFFSQKAMTFCG
mgnify:CR=1 FL=1